MRTEQWQEGSFSLPGASRCSGSAWEQAQGKGTHLLLLLPPLLYLDEPGFTCRLARVGQEPGASPTMSGGDSGGGG